MSNPTLPSPTPTAASSFEQPPVLTQIQTKVRRLTRSPSEAQLSTADLNNYINTFVVYDFPEQLRTFNLRSQFTFFTNPGQDVYQTDIASFAGALNNPLYNFQNLYISVHEPFYVAGFQAYYSQNRQNFFGIYPFVNNISSIGVTGDGTAGPFTGVINSQQALVPAGTVQQINLLQNQVLFSAIGTPGTSEVLGMAMVDVPLVDATTGFKLNFGNLYDPNSAAYNAALVTPPTVVDPNNNINYITGAYVVNFPMNTIVGTAINSETVPVALARPQAILFYQNEFTVRPVPDQSYRIDFDVYQRPVALLASNQAPELEEYWQLISYGASRKILQDRMDVDTVQLIEPEFREQLRLCLRRTIVQQTNERVATIYTDQTSNAGGWGWWGNTGGGTF
jgi:hypothetical protein